ncbi:MAG: N-6 DNA methylase [Chloroflexi bacterium]|nr:N-6 DNA methylase [Chloroflexota bacterium]
MTAHLDVNDPRFARAAAAILDRHERNEPEANITSAVRDFLIRTGLAQAEQMAEENPPSDGSRRAVDLTALDTFIEFKRRVGTAASGEPDPDNVRQLDDYLEQSAAQGRIRMGILTDGRRWLLRWPGAGEVRLTRPYAFTLDEPNGWLPLYEWLRDYALVSLEDVTPNRQEIALHFGPDSPAYQRDIAALKALYAENAELETIRVKRRLWYDLLRTALGEIAYTTEGMSEEAQARLAAVGVSDEEMDDLFVRHTYLGAVIGMVVQASFGIDIRGLAENDPADLLQGRELHRATGLQGVLESDFFAWPVEVGGNPLLRTLARRVARFNWTEAPSDTAAVLYEAVIPPDERRQLGEYYTPAWLARVMVQELVDDPLQQRVLDPACGSGTFIVEAVAHFIAAAQAAKWEPIEALNRLRNAVTGIDVHPVAVHLARAAWTLAARPAISAAHDRGFDASLSIPVYLGDALQLRFRTGDLFAESQIAIQTHDNENTELVFPVSLVERAENFDALMGDISAYIEAGEDPMLALDDNHVNNPAERQVIGETIKTLKSLHEGGRDHIWAYYTRNMVRPVALSRAKVDVVIGNPPWINYNQTADILRDELLRQGRNLYGIWAGRHYTTQQDVAGLFFARSVDLYLKDGGVIGFVLPHSALQAGHYAGWRSGQWQQRGLTPGGSLSKRVDRTLAVDFGYKTPWDLEQLEPNNFFPMVSCVVFAERTGENAGGTPLAGAVEQWLGTPGSANVLRVPRGIPRVSGSGSPYADYARNGATIFPRCLFFVNETENPAIVQVAQTVTVNPRRGSLDKAPWKDLNLTAITGQTVERQHLFDVHLGETVAPYVTLEPLQALLPLKQGDTMLPIQTDGPGGIRLGGLERWMRERWRTVNDLWERNRALANRLNLLGQLAYMGKLSAQLRWQSNHESKPVRLVYTSSGQPTAAVLKYDDDLVENVLFWVTCKDVHEANYMMAIINSDALHKSVESLK